MNYLNQITQGDCLKLTDSLLDNSIDACIIDPPYGENLEIENDAPKDAHYVLNEFLQVLKPKLKQNAHGAIFWTMRNVDICIDAIKKNGYTFRRVLTMYLPKGNARPYLSWLPRVQAIVLFQKYTPSQPTEFHYELSTHIKEQMVKKGYTNSSLSRELGCNSRLIMKWSRPHDPSWCLPTPRFYPKLKELLELDEKYDFMTERESGKKQNRQFNYQHDIYIVDEKLEEMIHPCQKPLRVIKHLVETLADENETVLDAFAGSGTLAVACKQLNRNFICFELSNEFYEIAKQRINECK